ncbi:alpha/beta hydrolase family protein [Paenibacillus selenitireducens]|nr:alpha/beta hydrolase [Paenibacillus selenitireducens]
MMSTSFHLKLEPHRTIRYSVFSGNQPNETGSTASSRGLLILSHGFKGFKDWGMFPYAAEQIAKLAGVDVITYNFSHNGVGEQLTEFTELDKFARNTPHRQLEDLKALISAVHANEGMHSMSRPLFLLGHSWAASMSLIHALDHPDTVAGVIAWNGSSHPDIFSEQEKQEMRDHGVAYTLNGRTKQQMPLSVEILQDLEAHTDQYAIVDRISQASFPIALIQGTDDFERLRRGSEMLIQQNPRIEWIQIPGGNHTFTTVHPFQGTTAPLEAAIHATSQFIISHLS